MENFQEKCAELEQTKGKLETLQQEYETKKKECLNLETTAAKFETQVSKLEREKGELICEVENRDNGLAKQHENVMKLQKQVKEIKEKLENSEVQVDELRPANQKLVEENRALFKQVRNYLLLEDKRLLFAIQLRLSCNSEVRNQSEIILLSIDSHILTFILL